VGFSGEPGCSKLLENALLPKLAAWIVCADMLALSPLPNEINTFGGCS
jgi:hypothetical protein